MNSMDAPHMASTACTYDSENRPPAFFAEMAEAWRYRALIRQLVERDIKVRYKRSILGIGWTLLNPLLMMAVLTIAFSQLFKFQIPFYPVYVFSGLILWLFFSQTSAAAMSQLIWGSHLMTRIYLPRTTFALSALGSGLVNLLFSLAALIVVMLITGVPVRPAMLWLPLPILLAAMTALGTGLFFSTLASWFTDVVDMYQILLSALYFLTPIIYPLSVLSEDLQWALRFNPMVHLVEAFRAPIYEGRPPDAATLGLASLFAVVSLVIGWSVFTSRADDIVYRL
ncbi:MAG: ABC transporter permease [Planctomycetes bacterium]|nr:ABC transporter permease [Planctomycetota bacterium]